jgi:hypothetical protein
MSITDTLKHISSIEANGTETPGAEKQISNQLMKRHFNESNSILSTWFRAWLACPLIIFASTFSCLSEGTEYPSDAYVRPTVDSLPVFETLCGVQPALANPLERAAKFATHRFELVERKGVPAAEWEFRFDKDPCPPAMINVDERLNQVPQKVLLTVSND